MTLLLLALLAQDTELSPAPTASQATQSDAQADPQTEADARAQAEEQTPLEWMDHWVEMHRQAVYIIEDMTIQILVNASSSEAARVAALTQLRAMTQRAQEEARQAPPDPLTASVLANLAAYDRLLAVNFPEVTLLLARRAPRDADQLTCTRFMEEQALLMARTTSELREAQQLFAQDNNIRLLQAPPPPSANRPQLTVELPGDPSTLSPTLRVGFASNHATEVGLVVDKGIAAFNDAVAAENLAATLAVQRPLMQAALAELQAIPPWMGDDLLIQEQTRALELLLRIMNKPLTKMAAIQTELTSEKLVDKYNGWVSQVNDDRILVFDLINSSTASFYERWRFDEVNAHNASMRDWALTHQALKLALEQERVRLMEAQALKEKQQRLNAQDEQDSPEDGPSL